MLTLTYGYKKPETGDRGSVFFPALEDDIQQLNDHNHDGSNSSKLTSSAVTATTQAILAAAWVAQGGGTYKQTVTMPGALQYNDYYPLFKNTATKHELLLTVERVSNTSYDVYINDNTINLTAFYLS